MIDITDDGDLMGVLIGLEDGIGQGNYGEGMGTTLVYLDRSKLGGNEGVGMVLSGGYFEDKGIRESDSLNIS